MHAILMNILALLLAEYDFFLFLHVFMELNATKYSQLQSSFVQVFQEHQNILNDLIKS